MAYQPRTSTLILGGGGGPSRSGVPNGFLLLKIGGDSGGGAFELIGELGTGDEAVMSLSLYDDKTECLVVAGVNDRCWLLELTSNARVKSIVNALNTTAASPLLPANSPTLSNAAANLFFLKSLQCDASPSDDGYLRVTRFLPSGRSLLAAGTDGGVRELAVPELRLITKLEDENGAGGDIIDTDGNALFIAYINSKGSIVYKSRSNPASSSSSSSSSSTITNPAYSFKLVRFLRGDSSLLVTVENCKGGGNPKSNSKKNPRISIYDLENGDNNCKPRLSRLLPIAKNATCIHICNQMDRIALGFADGSLLVLCATRLTSIYFLAKEAHPFPVTGLAFDPQKSLLLSASADGTVQSNRLSSKPIYIASPAKNIFYFLLILTILVLLVGILLADKLGNFKFSELDDFDSFYKLFPTEIIEP